MKNSLRKTVRAAAMYAPGSGGTAAALARRWNASHTPSNGVLNLEIRFARLGRTSADDTFHELLLATWPPRDDTGRGSLDQKSSGD